MKIKSAKIVIIIVIAMLATAFFALDLHHTLTLETMKARQGAFSEYYRDHMAWTLAVYMAVYILVTALSLPGATVMTLVGGGRFGLWVGVVVISFASTIGATLAFLASRFILKDWVQGKFGEKLRAINDGVARDGAFYLFTLRLVPLFPFFVINLVMGLTPIRAITYYWVSQIGMLPGTFVYVNAGTQLAKIDSLGGILSPGLILSFALLGIFPWVAKKIIAVAKARRSHARWPRPPRFEYNLVLICDHDGETVRVPFDEILVAVGRAANTKGFGLEALGVALRPNGTVAANGLLQTNFSNIYCAGDVAGPYRFTHTAAHQAWYAAVNALFGRFKTFSVDYRVIPWATYTDPEVARVGLNELEAKEKGVPYEAATYGIDDLDRAIADSEDHGLVRVLTPPGSDKILGVTIVGAHASDIIAEFVLAMKYNLGLNKILGTIHIYPTLAEANKFAAGQWKRAHAPERLLGWVRRYHAWMRG